MGLNAYHVEVLNIFFLNVEATMQLKFVESKRDNFNFLCFLLRKLRLLCGEQSGGKSGHGDFSANLCH